MLGSIIGNLHRGKNIKTDVCILLPPVYLVLNEQAYSLIQACIWGYIDEVSGEEKRYFPVSNLYVQLTLSAQLPLSSPSGAALQILPSL